MTKTILLALALCVGASAQVGLGPIDLSAASTTKPFQVVASDPSGSCGSSNAWEWSTASHTLWFCNTTWQKYAPGTQTFPSAGIMVSTGTAFGTSLTAPASTIVGISDTQTLTAKTVDGVTPTVMAYLDVTSSVQTQLNAKVSTSLTTNNILLGVAGVASPSPLAAPGALQGYFSYKFSTSGAPGTIAGNEPGDFAFDSGNNNLYWCGKSFGTAAPACTAVATQNWELVGAGGSSAFSAITGSTNSSAAMVVGTGSSLGTSGTGTIAATNVGYGLTLVAGNMAANTGVLTSVPVNQSGVQTICHSISGNTTYVCSLVATGSAALVSYTYGMRLGLVADTASATTATLNVDTVGQLTLYEADCATPIGTSVLANQMYPVWYNGTAFCLSH